MASRGRGGEGVGRSDSKTAWSLVNGHLYTLLFNDEFIYILQSNPISTDKKILSSNIRQQHYKKTSIVEPVPQKLADSEITIFGQKMSVLNLI